MNYINNKEFYAALLKRKTLKEDSVDWLKNHNYIGRALMLLVDRIASKPCFYGYTYLDDMKGGAIEMCLCKLDKFDCDKSKNPFSYFTTTIYNVFLQFIEKEKRQRLGMYRLFRNKAEPQKGLSESEKEHINKMDKELDNYETFRQKRSGVSKVSRREKKTELLNKQKSEV